MSDSVKKNAADASKMLVKGALQLFANVSAPATSTPAKADSKISADFSPAPKFGSPAPSVYDGVNPEEIPREELLALCMKMNKRMQIMESKGQELVKKKGSLLSERRQLLEALMLMGVATPLSGSAAQDDADLDIESVMKEVSRTEEERRTDITTLLQKIAKLEEAKMSQVTSSPLVESASEPPKSDQSEVVDSVLAPAPVLPSTGLVDEAAIADLTAKNLELQKEIDRAKRTEESLRQQLSGLQENLRAKTSECETLKTEVESTSTGSEEKIIHLQMQMKTLKAKDEEKDRELTKLKAELEAMTSQLTSMRRLAAEKESAVGSNREVIGALQNKLFDLEPELERAKERNRELERNLNAQTLLKAEQESLLTALRRDLKSMIDAKDESVKRAKELELFKMKAEAQIGKMGGMSEQLTALQTSIDEKDAMITRLRSEKDAAERNHAMRTAMLAATEAQLEALKAEVGTKEQSAKEAQERVVALQAQLVSLEEKMEEKLKSSAATIAQLETAALEARRKQVEEIAQLRDQQEQAVDACKKDYAKKSALARTLLSEKEEEARVLAAKNQELVEEIQSGAPNERRIFELAERQAKREAMHGIHSDTRELAFQQLQAALAARDLDLARVQQSHSALAAEVSELRRHTKREGVNMDYLKNVVLQYMSFPVQSPERSSLVPVIAMLLQFNVRELAQAENALKEPIWSQRPVKEIKRALQKASASPYAMPSSAPSSSSGTAPGAGYSMGMGIAESKDIKVETTAPSSSSGVGTRGSGSSSGRDGDRDGTSVGESADKADSSNSSGSIDAKGAADSAITAITGGTGVISPTASRSLDELTPHPSRSL